MSKVARSDISIPYEMDDTLFFLSTNGMSYAAIVEKYKDTELEFTEYDLVNHAKRHRWVERKRSIEKDLKSDFDDIIKAAQAKKMTATSMAVQTVCDMMIHEIEIYRKDPDDFMKKVMDRKIPRPVWMVKDMSELSELFKLQNLLDENKSKDQGSGPLLPDHVRANMLKLMAEEEMKQLPARMDQANIIDVTPTEEFIEEEEESL